MPRSFPDMNSLKRAAEVHKFRKPKTKEDESAYRDALADHVAPVDFIESEEIRNGVGWDQFSAEQNAAMLMRNLNKK